MVLALGGAAVAASATAAWEQRRRPGHDLGVVSGEW